MLYRHQMIKEIISLFTMNTHQVKIKKEQKVINPSLQAKKSTSDILEKRVEDYVMFILTA